QRGGGRVERALEVDVDHRLEVLGSELEERPVHPDARVGDDAVKPAEMRDGLLDSRVDRAPVPDVADDADRAVEPEVVAGSRQQGDLRALPGERASDRGADPAAGPGDERPAAVHARPVAALRRRESESSVTAPRSTRPVTTYLVPAVTFNRP